MEVESELEGTPGSRRVFEAGTHQSMLYSGGMSHSGKWRRGKVEKPLDGAVGIGFLF